MAKRKHTIETVRAHFAKHGHTLITKEYKNVNQKLTVLCSKGHTWYVYYNDFLYRNNSCQRCAGKIPKGPYKSHTLETVREKFAEKGYTLLSDEYINPQKPVLTLRCKNGHIWKTTYGNFLYKGCHCNQCMRGPKWSTNYVSGYLAGEGYELLSPYNYTNRKLKLRCPRGHVWNATFGAFQTGYRCSIGTCNGNLRTDVEQELANYGLSLVSEFLGTMKHVEIKCSKDHSYRVLYNNLKKGGFKCKECNRAARRARTLAKATEQKP